jgi:fluoroquinolone transport system ATP-binding protein
MITGEPVIEARELTYTYAGATERAIHSLNFQVEQGEIIGFLGPSGAGKSTTQRILIKLLGGYKGSVSVLGRDLAAWGQDYYEQIGVAFEFPNHFLKLTALENLDYFASLYSRETQDPRALLDTVDLLDSADMPVSQFSKGMKTRLSVARAMLHNPGLLFLDEPTTGLDPVNSRRVRDLIREQKSRGRTVFLTTHDMSIADDLCDRVAFITNGRVRLIDTPRALKLRYGAPTVQVEYGKNGHRDREEFSLRDLGRNEEFLRVLRAEEVQTIHTQEASLEEIFVQVTGAERET